ncbi:G8 domain-containing protein [Anthocerotibacter panamensis]|uniref:G8 domain-containing protein n=1 Tax=Anthocerotibacter panamensis TaxID=2857077 RepID=UPI001C40309B|nr:G8 domain-containing protein [Anthocerotibacter panamensis]
MLFLFTTPASAQTQQRWSDPATWGGVLPQSGDEVVIPSNRNILLDISPPPLKSLTIQGGLSFDNRDITLTSDWIIVMGGRFQIGTAQVPYPNRAVVTLTGNDPNVNIMGMGNKFLAAMSGGSIEMHGAPKTSWVRLNANALTGTTQLVLNQPVNWQPNDQLVVASTNFNPYEAEVVRIKNFEKDGTVNLTTPLAHLHWGTLQTYGQSTLDERAEVGLLNRNILIQGDATSPETGFGGHIMAMDGSQLIAEGVELYRLGQQGRLGRYPWHWHLLGNGGTGQYIKNSSVHDSFNRCITVHGTNNTLVQGNVAYNASGHCFFVEDGVEVGNTFDSNLGLVTKRSVAPLIPSDSTPATYWISNPNNRFTNNVAAGADDFGFWYDIPPNPTGPSADPNYFPQQQPFGGFDSNVAHSTLGGTFSGVGIWLENVLRSATITNNTSYKNVNRAIYLGLAGSDPFAGHTALHSVSADSPTHYYGWNATFDGGLAVATSANVDDLSVFTTLSWNGGVLRGIEEYDGWIRARNTTFVNFIGTGNPELQNAAPWAGVATVSDAHFTNNPLSGFQKVTLINSYPAYYRPPGDVVTQPSTFTVEDTDGSLGGVPGFVVYNRPLLLAAGCVPLPTLTNAQACPGSYGGAVILSAGDPVNNNLAPLYLQRDDGAQGQVSSNIAAFQSAPGSMGLSFSNLQTRRTYTLLRNFGQSAQPLPPYLEFSLSSRSPAEWIAFTFSAPSEVFAYLPYAYTDDRIVAPASSLTALLDSPTRGYFQDPTTRQVWVKVFGLENSNAEAIGNFEQAIDICLVRGCPNR